MAKDSPQSDTTPMERQLQRITLGCAALAAAWVGIWAVSAYRIAQVGLSNQIDWLLLAVGLFMPLGLIAVGWSVGRVHVQFRDEIPQLVTSIQSLRSTIAQNKAQDATHQIASLSARLDLIASQNRTVTADIQDIKRILHTPPAPLQPSEEEDERPSETTQGSLALPFALEEAAPLDIPEFIAALNFPRNENDAEGFALFRRAMQHRPTAQILRAAQDVLTLLSEDGIFMDDLAPDFAHPSLWRRFAQGERGRAVGDIAGIHDKTCLALISGRMKVDGIFRDAAHHFLRQFDKSFAQFAPNATDADLQALSDTRTARAFMVIARATGTFDQ